MKLYVGKKCWFEGKRYVFFFFVVVNFSPCFVTTRTNYEILFYFIQL